MEYEVCTSGEEAKEKLRGLLSGDYGLILVEEEYYDQIKEIVESLREEVTPAITFIPGAGGSTGKAREKLRGILLKAIGIDIF
jgi:vacuolar-type H+-ATPase subunit F/Vma7